MTNTLPIQQRPRVTPIGPMQVYSRDGYRVLPLCAGFVVVGRDGKEIDRYEVGDINGAVDLVDELVLKVA